MPAASVILCAGIQVRTEITEVGARMPITTVNWLSRHSSKEWNYRSKSKNADYFRKLAQPAFKQGQKLPK